MKITFRLILLVVLVAAGGWLWTVLFPSPEKMIRQRIAHLADAATFKPGDSPLLRASQAAEVVGYFSTDAEIAVENHILNGRDEIREQVYAGFASLPGLKTAFLDVNVRVNPDHQSAQVNCTARIFLGDDKDYGLQELRFQLRKIEGKWLITKLESQKTLS